MGILSTSDGGGLVSSLAGGLYPGNSGLCVFTCAAILSAAGAVASLMDLDIGSESAFFATTGLGALCFADCQYLRLVQERGGIHGKAAFGNRDGELKK